MKFAIIAAGEGSRLAREGIETPKPLVKIGGEHLIDRLIRIFLDNGADEIVVVCNGHTPLLAQHLADIQRQGLSGREVPLRYKVRTTPSSMHSFYELIPWLSDDPFVLTTVDTVFDEQEFRRYVSDFKRIGADGLMGVTDYVDDERPLYVGTDVAGSITGFYDSVSDASDLHFVSGGIYGLTPRSLSVLQRCVKRGEMRMRNFQRALIAEHLHLVAWPFSRVLDVDHAADVAKAESMLNYHVTK